MYIGHARLEQLLARVPSGSRVCLTLLEEWLAGADGTVLIRLELMLQGAIQETTVTHILYWRMLIGQTLAPGGNPWPQALQRLRGSGNSAHTAIREFLTRRPHPLQIEEGAVIAMPRNLKLINGQADCLAYDEVSHLFRLRGSAVPHRTAASAGTDADDPPQHCAICGREVTGHLRVSDLTEAPDLSVICLAAEVPRDWIACDACQTVVCHHCCRHPESGYCDRCIEKYDLLSFDEVGVKPC